MSNKSRKKIQLLYSLLVFGVLILTTIGVSISGSAELPKNQYHILPVDETLRAGRRDGFEPHIIAGPSMDGTGEWYYYDSPSGMLSPGVSNTRRPGNVWISKDYGFTWEFKEKDMVDWTPQDPGASGDTFIAISKGGALFHTDLYLSSASVDVSLNGGEDWYLNPMASVYVFDDRQWLDIGPAKDGLGDETLYFSFNQLFPFGLVMVKTPIYTEGPLDNYLWTPCNNGLPITTDVAARDPFCVDEQTGTIYITNYASGARNLEVWKSTNGGDSFTQHIVADFSGRPEVQNIFTVIDTDMDGNIYITYSSRDNMWLAVSTDEAESWTIHQVTDNDPTSVKVLPWVAGGDGGRAAMAWYESEAGTTGSPDTQSESWWDLNVAISHNAADPVPDFEIVTVHEDVHYGGVQTTGTGGGSDRDLGDFLTCDIDNNGRLLISYGFDRDDGPNARLSYPMYAGQMDGPFLRDDTGPEVNPSFVLDGSKVTLDLEDISDLSGFGIANVTIDWGDGSSPEVLENATVVTHDYSGGSYKIQVRAANAIGMRTTEELKVSIDEEGGWEIAGHSGWLVVGSPLILLLIIAFVLFSQTRGNKENEQGGLPLHSDDDSDKDPNAIDGVSDVVWEIDPEKNERAEKKGVTNETAGKDPLD